MSIFNKSVFAALAFFSIIGQANAGIVTITLGAPESGSLLETFDELPINANSGTLALSGINGSMTLNNAQIVQGSVTNQYAAPYLDTTQYVSVYGNGSASFSLNNPTNYVGIEWGSVDGYNNLTLYNGSNVIGNFNGLDITGAANFASLSAFGTVYANFNSTEAITSIVASSGGNSFEFDNVRVTATPLPASLPMFMATIIAMGALGTLYSRRLATTA